MNENGSVPARRGLGGWIRGHAERALKLDDTPRSIAIGVAAGVFFGFTPLFGLKTLFALGAAWVLRGNKVAAAVAVTFHDVLLPIIPLILRFEYVIGYWLLYVPHELPPKVRVHEHLSPGTWLHWSTFLTIGRPVLVGSVIFAIPFTVAAFYGVRWVVARRRKTIAES